MVNQIKRIMKELSIEQKARRYDEALEKSKRLYEQGTITESLAYIFTELKESEEEKTRKEIIEFLKKNLHLDWAIWLEKQVQKPQGKSALEASKEEKVDNQNCIKPADKVEPKFHNGQWIVWQCKCYKVNDSAYGYELVDQNDLSTSLEYGTIDENAHLWDITKDAKDGDVLVHNAITFIFMGIENGIVKGICTELSDTILNFGEPEYDNDYCPATKEQRDALMKAMADAGYTFDFVKKELKKIEQKPAWSEEDEYYYGIVQYILNNERVGKADKENASNWFKSIKDRVQPQPKQEWSEEDEKNLEKAIWYIEKGGKLIFEKTDKLVSWLKSLRPQNTWKPSDEHYELEELAKIVRGNLTSISKAVQELFEAKYLQLTGNKMYGGYKD